MNNDNGAMVQKKGAKKGLPVSFLQQSSVIKFFCASLRVVLGIFTRCEEGKDSTGRGKL